MQAIRGNELIREALGWYRRGVVPIPLHHASKRPALAWSAWAEARPEWDDVLRVFDTRFYRGIGVLTGPVSGNLVVLDFDRPLCYVKWKARARVRSFTVRTSRGYHVYTQLSAPPAGTLSMKGGEVKASGYVVAPPSFHPSGRAYVAVGDVERIVRAPDLEALGVCLSPGANRGETPASRSVALPEPGEPESGRGIIADIKRALPITQLLARNTEVYSSRGAWLMCRCPLHDDHTPSMWIHPEHGLCRCFKPGCPGHRKPMDVINLYAALTGLSNGEAIAELARRLGL